MKMKGKNLAISGLVSFILGASVATLIDNTPNLRYIDYLFNDVLNGKEIKTQFNGLSHNNYLTIKKADGTKIEYIDNKRNDLKLDKIVIKTMEERKAYNSKSSFGKEILEEAQKQFDDYLATIKAINYNKALESIEK